MQISQTVALVTGGASGLGEATARHIVGAGGKVALLDRDATRGQAVAGELGASAVYCETDVTDPQSVSDAISTAQQQFGKITAAVNCAGIAIASKTVGRDGPHDLDLYRKVIDVNLVGTFNVCRLAAAAMQTNEPNADGERGVLVNTASVAAFDGQKGQAAYTASKAGVAGAVLPMARDLAGQGIRVNAIAPGLFLTPMLQVLDDEARAALAAQVLFPKRLGDPAEFGRLAAFIIESPYLNGETIRFDGGIRMP